MINKFFIGIDIGGTKISAAAISPTGRILGREKIATPPKAKPATILKLIIDLIDEIILENNLARKNLSGIGIGVPGIVNKDNHILATPNIQLAGFHLCAKLKKKLRVKVVAGNDVNLGLLGEQWLGAGQKAKNIIGIFPGTGVGGAIIIDGKLLIGSQGAAAELGHMSMALDGPTCSCGNRGCLEAFAGRWAIERDLHAAIKAGRKSKIVEISGGHLATIKSKSLKTALKQKDPLTVEVMTKASRILGQACINVRHIFNPDLIILGGGIIEACGEFMLPIINKTFRSDPFFAKIDHCTIAPSQLGDDAVMLGAAALIKKSQ